MNPEQFNLLISLLQRFLERKYTLTGAADWPLLLVVGGGFAGLLVYIWHDLKATIRGDREDWKRAVEREERERQHQDELIWSHIRDCQDDCCPRGKEIRKEPRG